MTITLTYQCDQCGVEEVEIALDNDLKPLDVGGMATGLSGWDIDGKELCPTCVHWNSDVPAEYPENAPNA